MDEWDDSTLCHFTAGLCPLQRQDCAVVRIGFGARAACICIPASPPFTSYVNLGQLLNFFALSFHIWKVSL